LIYFLDTNVVIAVLNNRPPAVRHRFDRALAPGASMQVPSVALFELWYGVARSHQRPESIERLRLFLSGDVTVVPFEGEDAETAGELRARLEAAGSPIGSYDLLIAAQALRAGATLVTANVSEFSRVPGLMWENWTAEA